MRAALRWAVLAGCMALGATTLLAYTEWLGAWGYLLGVPTCLLLGAASGFIRVEMEP